MKKFDIRNLKVRKASINELGDRLLLANLYLTQLVTFIIGLLWVILQGRNPIRLFAWPGSFEFLGWSIGLSAAIVLLDVALSRWMPEEAMDDGGVNERIFRTRPIWHIALICLVVSICEELLFRGAIQHSFGPYWTSILFAAIHVRYLRHWIPTGMVFAISYGFGWMYVHTGTLWAPIAAHFLVDLIMGLIIRLRRDKQV
ncbi:type II CAAX endopeptidase family protein [Cohnella lubricantis]|uniref:CPBP family intramembrane metalloprotease n=1 Tax=Cohnella lubricantis TaxID=2163172 RepID=A0A841T8U0_9BACL|nr:type II CAAX endopeptidase family protein [Cohnella lubricantis]MBB6677714.1 CPBP family intramembrane metalloprotease [Cohnella lubricantis]MBP2117676.1 membrane protease YdiL (CAAX protease family) [Cohnella lubricantis]